jgi:glutamyl-tRNA synthetase
MTTPRLRFAPSPTGYLHIGGARTALFNWLYARKHKGTFVLRMEDTDRERSTPESVQAILDGLRWLGIDWDEGPEKGGDFGPYFQTQRIDLYKKYSDQLIAQGKAYRCYCTKELLEERRKVVGLGYKYEGTCRDRKDQPNLPFVVRFRMPDGEGSVGFNDGVAGPISKEYSDLDDFVMLRGDGIPLYNYGCVIDDHLMSITLVARGQEHINSTFPQLMLYRALDWEPPQFVHLPLIMATDGKKLSKRLHPEADVMIHKANGILPEALVNFVARIGWSHGDDEVISREQMVEWFDWAHVGHTQGVWDPTKLLWLNEQWMKKYVEAKREADLVKLMAPFLAPLVSTPVDTARLELAVRCFHIRTKTLKEMAEMAAPYFRHGVAKYDDKAVAQQFTAEAKPVLQKVRDRVNAASTLVPTQIDGWIKEIAEELYASLGKKGMGKVAQPVRVAVTGSTASPGIGDTLTLLGRDEVLFRLDAALAKIA